MLNKERIDLLIASSIRDSERIKELNKSDEIIRIKTPFFKTNTYFVFSEKSKTPAIDSLYKQISQAMIKMKKDGFFENLKVKYPYYIPSN